MTEIGKRGFLAVFAAVLVTGSWAAWAQEPPASSEGWMKIRIVVDGTTLDATLEDNAASRDFAAMLPLNITLSDYHGTEKIADLPAGLSTKGAPEGIDPDVGDITYFAPWGNLALFYRDFGYSRGLVRLGRIVSGVEHLVGGDSLKARIERVEEPQ